MDGTITVNGSIENNLKVVFQQTLLELARKKESLLSNIPAVFTAPFEGRTMGITRAGGVNLKVIQTVNEESKLLEEEKLINNYYNILHIFLKAQVNYMEMYYTRILAL